MKALKGPDDHTVGYEYDDAGDLAAVMDWLHARMKYDPASSSLIASSEHALAARAGNCSEYHGLCAAFGRSLGFPTRVVYGITPLPKNSPSHCKCEAYLPPYGWVSFDVSETPTGVDLSAYDVIVLGSAVYAGHWLDEAKSLAARIGETRPRPAVWLFSSGPIGDPPRPEEVPVDVAVIAEATEAREHVVFAGKLDRSMLRFGERAIVMALRAPEGDFRDWAAIEEWANKIAELSRRESD